MATVTLTPQLVTSITGTVRREDFIEILGVDMTYLRDGNGSTGIGYVASEESDVQAIEFSISSNTLAGNISSAFFEFDINPAEQKYTATISRRQSGAESSTTIAQHVGSSTETVSVDITSGVSTFSALNSALFTLSMNIGEVIVSEIRIIVAEPSAGKVTLIPTTFETEETDEGLVHIMTSTGGKVIIRKGKVTLP